MSNSEDKVLLAIRNSKGQIGYLSDGITIPEFYELMQPKQNNINILVDFSPIIDILYNAHNQQKNEKIHIDYNSLYNYFLDVQTYENKTDKLEKLIDKSNDFLNLLKVEFYKTIKNYNFTNDDHQKYNFVNTLKYLSNLYFDSILIFMHTKATLDIKSFKNDIVLTNYIQDIKKKIYSLYKKHIKVHGNIVTSDFLLYILFEREEDLSNYLNIIEDIPDNNKNIENIKLQIFENSSKENIYNNYNEPRRRIYSEYHEYSHEYINIAEILMNTLYKINSVYNLLEKLKNHEVEFKNDKDTVEQVKQLIKLDT